MNPWAPIHLREKTHKAKDANIFVKNGLKWRESFCQRMIKYNKTRSCSIFCANCKLLFDDANDIRSDSEMNSNTNNCIWPINGLHNFKLRPHLASMKCNKIRMWNCGTFERSWYCLYASVRSPFHHSGASSCFSDATYTQITHNSSNSTDWLPVFPTFLLSTPVQITLITR